MCEALDGFLYFMKKSKFIRVILQDGSYFIFNRKKVLRVFMAQGVPYIKIEGLENAYPVKCDFDELCKIISEHGEKAVSQIFESKQEDFR